ncbi:MAG: DMT family transporter, partial [Alphaproteobacteria bacterium]
LAWGQQFIDSGLAAVLNSTTPIFVFLLTFFITKHEQLNWYKFAGVILGLGGVCLIVGVNVLDGLGQQILGQLAALTGAFLYSIGAIYGKKFKGLPPVVTAASIMLISSIVLVPASFILDAPLTLQPTAKAWVCVVLLSVFSTALAFLIYFRLINTLGSLGTTSQGFMRCGIAITLGVVVLGEVVTPTLAIGLAVAVLGVALINLPIQNMLNYLRQRTH